MNARTLLSLGLLAMTPALLAAQTAPEPPMPAVAPAPSTPSIARAPRVPSASRPAVAVAAEPAVPAPEAVPQPAAPPKPAAAPAPVSPVAPAMAIAPPKPVGQLLNVQIEVTLADSKGTPKTVLLTVADGELGQNRTGSNVLLAPNAYKNFSFNADARPSISGSKVRLYLSAEAEVPSLDAKGSAANITLRQSQTLILNDGDSVEIARAADPVSDRAFVLSVKVKIQR